VAVYSYNSGPKKVQISRELIDQEPGRPSFAKLGRLTKEELQGILPLLQEALTNL
jgi:predicted transcriptional regulator